MVKCIVAGKLGTRWEALFVRSSFGKLIPYCALPTRGKHGEGSEKYLKPLEKFVETSRESIGK